MRDFDTIGIRLCDEQAELFETSVEYMNISSPQFIKNFMYSNISNRFDSLAQINFISSSIDLLDELKETYSDSADSENKYSKNVMHWIGYMYRYWCYTREITSIEVYKIIKPSELKMIYLAYHSMDPEMVIERINEYKKIKETPKLQESVKLYRQIKKQS